MREEFRELNGLTHRVLVWSGPERPSVVLVHGFLDLSWSFAPFAEELQRRLPGTLFAPDLRGHGETERVGRGGYYHFPDYVADLHDLLASLPAPRFLVGHSMGGVVSVLAAGAFPELVDRLVVIEGLGPPAQDRELPARMAQWIREVRERKQKPPRTMSREEAEKRLREQNPRMSEGLAKLLAEKATRAVEGGVTWAFDPLHRTRSPHPYSAEEFRSFLRAIRCPTLLVEGAESGFRQYVGDERATDIRDVREVVIAGAGHMVHQDRPAELAEAVAGFLGG